ncbi:MAG TPA: ribbon-helix-helix domain-containing protein [bacterium]|jgi:RHH-type rel operon transcriptional repressor/antitoxin RelB|nr:ribbon-helix-helix domain-containing protein [bacterium]HNT67087.1 ribbon-helix-helix domain-containing protein [bacterium]HPG47086.1 ribbon-helix-helix domain-containing protein [bacterium]HPG47158.1 ribbon-helix-helix domain-containing protein [bacterium]
MSVTLSLRLPEELAAELDRIASETERSKSFHVQKAIESYLKEQADLQIALDRLHDSSDAVISMDEMRNNLGL